MAVDRREIDRLQREAAEKKSKLEQQLRDRVDQAQREAAERKRPVKDRALDFLAGFPDSYFTDLEIYRALYPGQEYSKEVMLTEAALMLLFSTAMSESSPTRLRFVLLRTLNELAQAGAIVKVTHRGSDLYGAKLAPQ